MTKSDADLHAEVAEELNSDLSLDASRIAVAVHDGVVTLTGTVPSYWQKIEAESAVKRVTGVRGIANDLAVELPTTHQRDDTDITRAAVDALEWHSDLPKTMKVAVSRGWVTLSGSVDWYWQKEEAERVVRSITGVKGVINSLTVKAAPKVSDVRERIKKELERTVDQEANRIEISTSDGHVTLTGTVHSWIERQAAERAAWSVPGVTALEDRLAVTP